MGCNSRKRSRTIGVGFIRIGYVSYTYTSISRLIIGYYYIRSNRCYIRVLLFIFRENAFVLRRSLVFLPIIS